VGACLHPLSLWTTGSYKKAVAKSLDKDSLIPIPRPPSTYPTLVREGEGDMGGKGWGATAGAL